MPESISATDVKSIQLLAELDAAVTRRLKENETLVIVRNEGGECTECKAPEGHEAGCALRKVEHEVKLATEEWLEVVQKIPAAQADYDKASAAEAKYDKGARPVPGEIAKAAERTLAALWAWLDRKVVLENQIRKVRSPAEIERRKLVNNRLREVSMASSNGTKKETARDQGVPTTYLGPSGNFKPGLDARYKSDLITSALGEKIGPDGLHQFTKDSALERLAQRNWLPHLEKAKKNREAKAAKAAEKAKATPRTRSASKSKAGPRPSSKKA